MQPAVKRQWFYVPTYWEAIFKMCMMCGSSANEIMCGARGFIYLLFAQIMSKKQNDIARSAMLVDTTVTVPTVTGFPFRIDLKATVTGGLKTDGQINLANAPGDMLIEGFIKPR